MNWLMIIFGMTLCTITIKSFLDDKKKPAGPERCSKRNNICLNVLSFLVGVGGILIGLGVFQQHMLNEVMLWVIVLCQFILMIVVKLWK